MRRTGELPGPGLTGKPRLLWEVDLPVGSAVAPLVFDGEVIVPDRDGVIRALDGETGQERWTIRLDSGVAWTPTIADGRLHIITVDGTLASVDLADRTVVWQAEGFLDESTVTVADGLVIAGRRGKTIALSFADGHEVWQAETGGSDRQAVAGETLLVGGEGSGRVSALDAGSGTERWRVETGAARVLTPAVTSDGSVVAVRDVAGGFNLVFGLDGSGKEQWRWEPPERDRIGSHTVANDRVFVARASPGSGFHALDRGTGTELWSRAIPGDVRVPVVVGDTLYVTSTENGLNALDAATGEVRWAFPLGRIAPEGGIVVSGGLVFVTAQDVDGSGRIIALAGDGDPRSAAAPSADASILTSAPVLPELPLEGVVASPIEGRSLLLSVAAAPDGTMYGADMWNSRIVIRHPDGEIEYWGERGGGDGEFDFSEVTEGDASTSVSVSPDGELIAVGDGANHRVQLFDASRRHLLSIGRLGRDDRQFVNPCCVTVDADHRIWVVDTVQAEVQVFDATGRHERTFGSKGSGEGQLDRPGSPFVDASSGEVYIPDFANRRVSVFGTDGTWLRHYDRALNPELTFDELNAVVVDRAGRLFAVDTTNRLFVVARDGTLESIFSDNLPEAGRIEYTTFQIDGDGRLYVADLGGTTAGRLITGQLGPPVWPPPGEGS